MTRYPDRPKVKTRPGHGQLCPVAVFSNPTRPEVIGSGFSVEHPQENGESNTTLDADGLPMPDFVNTNPKGKWWSKKKNNAVDQKSDLEKYLAEEIHDNDNNFDIMAWWKENSNKYKILSLIARDVLAVPVSTVASESAFSTEFNFNDRDFDQYEETDSIASDVSGESTVSVDAMNID
ncbi:zinc finger BED domain-containing protein RICESLEEPER 2-like [Senna tora]|uniref:Zinc finger BED domain-containing protein RICESLEEPER 2-like n=1 Tax=Senna tora TaxID=362788 RepID=A0A834T169_9FABA|nr:zinc finger BED domain-containing protein RICESLEEPER 2-like [Senna tora]